MLDTIFIPVIMHVPGTFFTIHDFFRSQEQINSGFIKSHEASHQRSLLRYFKIKLRQPEVKEKKIISFKSLIRIGKQGRATLLICGKIFFKLVETK